MCCLVLRSNFALLLTIQFALLISSLINIISLDVALFNLAVTLKLKCGIVVCVEFFIFEGSLLGRIQGDREPVSFMLYLLYSFYFSVVFIFVYFLSFSPLCFHCGFPSSSVSSFIPPPSFSSSFPFHFFLLARFISWGRLPDSSCPALFSSPSCCSFSSFGCPYSPPPPPHPHPPLFRSFLVRFSLAFLLLIFLSWLSSSFFILFFSSSFLSYFPILLFSPLCLLLLFLLLLLLRFLLFFVFSSSIGRFFISFCFPFLASSFA